MPVTDRLRVGRSLGRSVGRSMGRIAWRAMAGLLIGLVLLVLAWLLFNLHDAEPQPRPAELALPPPRLADDRNAFFALAGLRAAADQEPAAAGRAEWLSRLEWAAQDRALNAAQRQQRTLELVRERASKPTAALLPSLSGPPYVCNGASEDCTAQWMAQAPALAAQRQRHAELGQRCDRLVAGALEFEERLPPLLSVHEPLAGHALGAVICSGWLRSGALLAWVDGRPEQATVGLQQADRLSRALLAGSQSLIGRMVAVRIQHDTLATITALALRDRAMAQALQPLLAQGPDQLQAIRRWMRVEAAFQQGAVAELDRELTGPSATPMAVEGGVWQQALVWASNGLARRHIGWHPQRTLADLDAHWLRAVNSLAAGVPAALAQAQAEALAAQDKTALLQASWRNPVGQVLQWVAAPAYLGYLEREADLNLHQQAAALAIAAQLAGVPATERKGWAAQQSLAPNVRERIVWSGDGQLMTVNLWISVAAPHATAPRRDQIRLAWPGHSTSAVSPASPPTAQLR